MKCSENQRKHLKNATIIDSIILSKNYLSIITITENGKEIWENSPPVSLLVIPFKENQCKGLLWVGDIWVFPMIAQDQENNLLITDSRGAVYYGNEIEGKREPEKHIEINEELQTSSDFQDLKNIHGTLYIVGNLRQVLRRDGVNTWTHMSESIEEDAKKRYRETFGSEHRFSTGFNCIDGFESDKEIYAAGNGSDVWKYIGTSWIPIDIGVLNEDVISICCAEDGFVYLGTAQGKLIKGRDGNWKEIITPLEDPLTSIVYFKGKVYLATRNRLYEYTKDKVKKVIFNTKNGEVPRRTGKLDVGYGWLLSVGEQSIAIYDGKEWKILYGGASEDFQSALDDIT